MRNLRLTVCSGLLATSLFSAASWADDMRQYKVTLTNLTLGQPIAPLLVVTHTSGMSFFTPGAAPAPELAPLAEAGNGHPMADKLSTTAGVTAAIVGSGGTPPGGSSTVTVYAREKDHLSIGAMLGNTNDAFAGLADVDLPEGKQMITYMALGYDAGTETNDELCSTVPGPACGGEALSPSDSGEGIVTIHNGIHGVGDLNAAILDWRNPVAKVTIQRMK